MTAVTAQEVAAELGDVDAQQLQAVARPQLMPLGPPAPGWVLPKALPPRRPPADPAPGEPGASEGKGPA